MKQYTKEIKPKDVSVETINDLAIADCFKEMLYKAYRGSAVAG